MRIDLLRVMNFKGFEDKEVSFHPEVTLIVGRNGTGKTSILEALSVAAGSWLLGFKGASSRHIRPADIRLRPLSSEGERHWEPQFPCVVEAHGRILGRDLRWNRSLNSPSGRTTYVDASEVKQLAAESDSQMRAGHEVTLPLVAYYGTGRLNHARHAELRIDESKIRGKTGRSRLLGYEHSLEPSVDAAGLTEWIARESWRAFQQAGVSKVFEVVQAAITRNLEGAKEAYFDANYGEVVIDFEDHKQPFSNLSAGQKIMMSLVGDIARRAAVLNPHLGDQVLAKTSGIVLVDELDLHLHPIWQRRVIEDLRMTFPNIQFVFTTHSPFLIQSLRTGDELLTLDGQPLVMPGRRSVDEIAQGIQGVSTMLGRPPVDEIAQSIQGVSSVQVGLRYETMKNRAKEYMGKLQALSDGEEPEGVREELAELVDEFADNPAYQAFLEMRRAVKLGS